MSGGGAGHECPVEGQQPGTYRGVALLFAVLALESQSRQGFGLPRDYRFIDRGVGEIVVLSPESWVLTQSLLGHLGLMHL